MILAAAAWVLFLLTPGDDIALAEGGHASLVRMDEADIPVFVDDLMYQHLTDCIDGSISYFKKLPEQTRILYGRDAYTAAHMVKSLECFAEFIRTGPAPLPLSDFIRRNYRVYVFSEDDAGVPVLFTGYYLPQLAGSLLRTDRFCHPVYGRPQDLVVIPQPDLSSAGKDRETIGRKVGSQVVPYYTRREIEEGRGAETLRPIVWVDDPVDLFFLHIQGSGSVRLPGGDLLHLHFDTTNGQPYRSIGKYLIENGKMKKEQVSMQSLRAYLKAHPEEMNDIFNSNDRYVFFKNFRPGGRGMLRHRTHPGAVSSPPTAASVRRPGWSTWKRRSR